MDNGPNSAIHDTHRPLYLNNNTIESNKNFHGQSLDTNTALTNFSPKINKYLVYQPIASMKKPLIEASSSKISLKSSLQYYPPKVKVWLFLVVGILRKVLGKLGNYRGCVCVSFLDALPATLDMVLVRFMSGE